MGTADWLRALTALTAVLGAVAVLVGSAGKLTRRLGERMVTGAYYVGYGFMTASMLLLVLRGCVGTP
jgi:hypothetical protein